MRTIPFDAWDLCTDSKSTRSSILEPIEDFMSMLPEIKEHITSWVIQQANVVLGHKANPKDEDDLYGYIGKHIDVVVNGPSAMVTELVMCCATYGVPLTLWYYNENENQYVEQDFFM